MIKSIFPLTLVISLRFFSLFVILPIISLYATTLEGSNHLLVGIMIGSYAFAQLFLQVPFGILSDKFGRKKIMIIGLLIFIFGSFICFLANDIYTLIFGRILQGSGAIGAVGTAMISDMVKEEKRSLAMAFMGGSIAIAFALSMGLGPVLAMFFGGSKIFLISAILSFLGIFILLFFVKNPPKFTHSYKESISLKDLYDDKNLFCMNITNFLQKALMILAFFLIPIIINEKFGISKQELYKAYAPSMFFGLLAMGLAAMLSEKKGLYRTFLTFGIILFASSYILFSYSSSLTCFIVGVVLFFVGFNMHEPLMQSMASKFSKIHKKGASLGVFNAYGYAGNFCGGLLGGYFLHNHSLIHISWLVFAICILWLFVIKILDDISFYKNLYISCEEVIILKDISNVDGIVEWYKQDDTLIIKYDSRIIDKDAILKEF